MRIDWKKNGAIIIIITLGTAVLLHLLGRRLWCPAGDGVLWSFAIWSQHNSQHLLDWYTPSHISHGLLFCLLFRWLLPKSLSVYAVSFAIALEAGWEVLENSDFIIQRYRETTMALDYFGDSVANSIADIAWCLLGFVIASRLRPAIILFVFLCFELTTLICVRDNLTLNVIMLIYPLDAVKQWQMPVQ